jgi:hypothetical protein
LHPFIELTFFAHEYRPIGAVDEAEITVADLLPLPEGVRRTEVRTREADEGTGEGKQAASG